MAKNKATLRIRNRQYEESLEPSGNAFARKLTLDDEMEMITEATVYTKENSTYITYEESEKTGMQDSRTMIKLTGDIVEVHRYGKKKKNDGMNLDLHLEKGRRELVRYRLPVGSVNIEMVTHDVDEEGFGKIFAEYSMYFGDETMGSRRNKLEMTIRPE